MPGTLRYVLHVELTFAGEVIEWRGPAPYLFVRVPEAESDVIHDIAAIATYGWGCIPVRARIGKTDYKTSLFPKEGGYMVPVKVAVRTAERLQLGDEVTVQLRIDMSKA